ncbi:alpha/beta fold hydrolase [Jatrophihabitans telluris]|uniref:Alpha/beta fold hydrolase n=1 Tax=Jatrophihabitans telluris TaxID=2038343 RepID=A0ABY4QXY8_9ACTN|nr:alpha/beta fold hydrolase [Jatrophihabitans telluris]UQX88087.1 alpha/beta fold hydrolase [Jatrophihabitans telluris]
MIARSKSATASAYWRIMDAMLSALAPARRRLVLVLGALIVVAVLAASAALLVSRSRGEAAPAPVNQQRVGPILLVPGYGGSRTGLSILAARLAKDTGRTVSVMTLPGSGTGDLQAQAVALGVTAKALLARTGAGSLDVVGYSAGGIVARLWADAHGGSSIARRIVTLGAPHHGTELASLGSLFSSACPVACQQLTPDSPLLSGLNASPVRASPSLVSIWSTRDDVILPPTSSQLAGALDVQVQAVCPASQVTHSALPTDPAVQSLVESELAVGAPVPLSALRCTG